MLPRAFLFLLFAYSVHCAKFKPVTLNKCCPKEEYLSKETNFTCVPGGSSSSSYLPKIYSPVKKMYLPEDKKPAHWTIVHQKPTCPFGYRLKPAFSTRIIVIENGSLFLPGHPSPIDPSLFCYNDNMAMVCFKEQESMEQPVSIKECCGRNAIFKEKSYKCVRNDSDTINLKSGFVFSGQDFPACGNDSDFVITGKFDNDDLQGNGSLLVRIKEHEVLLDSDAYCIEHVLEKTGKSL